MSTGIGAVALVAALFASIATLLPSSLIAQDSASTKLPPVVVQVGRDAGRAALELPYAITTITPDSARPGERHASLDETLFLVPGVIVFNRNNPAQDARISIRGFGARSAFGVRGIRVMRDGIPLTLPDGQTPVDYLDLENVGRVDVLRGSASSLYGNAGGGVIDIHSSDPGPPGLSASTKAWSGTDASRKLVAQTAGRLSGFSYQTTASKWATDGFRANSAQRTTTGDVRAQYSGKTSAIAISFEGFKMPLAQSPGALTLAQFQTDPTMADPLSVRKAAGKTVKQAQFGATGSRFLGGEVGEAGEIRAAIHVGRRSLYNPLTFGTVRVRRHSSGVDVRGNVPWKAGRLRNRFTAGVELERQNDDRFNYANCTDLTTPLTKPTAACPAVGVADGTTTLDQRELVRSSGLYVGDELNLSPRYIITASTRADAVRFAVADHLINATNPDDSGMRTLRALSPMLGFLIRLGPGSSYYWNVSTAFETPTATELGNHPDGSAGINQDLRPQRSLTYEMGFKGINGTGLRYDVALFTTRVRDELIPFEIPASNGRRFFRNAGRTNRRGLELSGEESLGFADLGVAYTSGDFKYRDYAVAGVGYAGNRIPGVPGRELQVSATLRFPTVSLVGEEVLSDKVFVDDANSVAAPAFGILNIRFVSRASARDGGMSIIAGVYNVFDRRYASSVAVNASAGKFFEPGQRRSVFAGFDINLAPKRNTPK